MSEAIWRVAQSVGFDDYELRPMLEAFAAALSQPAPAPQPAAPVVSAEQIEDLAWLDVDEHGEIDRSSENNKMMTAPQRCAFKRGARAILARRPVQVPMTDNDVDAKCLTIIGHLLSRRERDRIVWRMAEAHHGVTTKAEGGA